VAELAVSNQTKARVVKNAPFELLKDCIIAKAQHQHVCSGCARRSLRARPKSLRMGFHFQMRDEIVRIISLGKAARVVVCRAPRL
jgi:hypothetical protein